MLESKVGKYFVITYALFALGVYAYVFFCSGATCSVYIILPVMPWALIWVRDLGLPFPWAIYPIFVLLNASVAYIAGVVVEWFFKKIFESREDKKIENLLQKKTTLHKS